MNFAFNTKETRQKKKEEGGGRREDGGRREEGKRREGEEMKEGEGAVQMGVFMRALLVGGKKTRKML